MIAKDINPASETIATKPLMEDLKRLITAGKEKGFLTYDEINEVLPEDLVSADQLDGMMMIFEEMNIEVVENEQQYRGGGNAESGGSESSSEEEEGDLAFDGDTAARVTDPVKMYLREMGQVCLLTREGEVEIAKRIEAGEREVFNAIMESPIGLREIVSLKEKLELGTIHFTEILRNIDDELTEEEENNQKTRIVDILESVRKLDEENKHLQTQILMDEISADEKSDFRDKMQDNKEKVVSLLKGLQIRKRRIDCIVEKLHKWPESVEGAERQLEACLIRCPKPSHDL
jgi:RNA polymerase primary sigma factor